MQLQYMGNTTNTSDSFQLTPKNPYLNKPPKKIFGKFPTQKISELKISNPPKILWSSLSLDYMDYLPGCYGKSKKSTPFFPIKFPPEFTDPFAF